MMVKRLSKSRLFAMALVLLCLLTALAPDADAARRKAHGKRGKARVVNTAVGTKDPRYADIVLNPVTGEVYHQQSADARRYPASLTKMMTLYLLFEALEKHKVGMDDNMRVSEFASNMPQTNLALNAGDTIDVETAIKALVVRSANDVAVVVAEHLGGNVDNFAEMMTAKARALGMRGTVFRNPNGLPNNSQYTTARDMAKLGIALKRDFPKYYPYFSTLQFSHDGVTYYTHNRVMLRYAGTDGIKTGYTGLSGFNLVTSVVRGGRPLMAVVLGGGSGRWRDDHMIELLDDAYVDVAKRGAARGKRVPANLPLPKTATSKKRGIEESELTTETPPAPMNLPPAVIEANNNNSEDGATPNMQSPPPASESAAGDPNAPQTAVAPSAPPAPPSVPETMTVNASPFDAASGNTTAPAATTNSYGVAIVTPNAPQAKASAPKVITPSSTAATSPFAAADAGDTITNVPASYAPLVIKPAKPPETMVVTPPAKPATAAAASASAGENGWGIQVGAFSSRQQANEASRNAMRTAYRQLISARVVASSPTDSDTPVYRARLENLNQEQARKACETMISNHLPCFIYKSAP